MNLAGYCFVRELAFRELVYGRSGVPGFSECGLTGIAGIVLCARGGVLIYVSLGVRQSLTVRDISFTLCFVRVGTSCPVSASLDLELGVGRLCLWTHETSNQHRCRGSCEPFRRGSGIH